MEDSNQALPNLGLKKILVSNAHVPGKTFELDVQDHTNIQGRNGSGKTSLLQLIPLFYGAEPRQVLEKSTSRKSFVGFYLPYLYSFIAFEYLREDGPVTAIVYRTNTLDQREQATYRFIKGSFAQTLDHPEVVALRVSSSNLEDIVTAVKRHCGVETSDAIYSITEYRSILEAHGSPRELARNNPKLLRNQQLFSYVPMGGKGAKNLGRMATTLLKRSNPFERLQDLIADSAFEDMEGVKDTLTKAELEQIRIDMISYSAIRAIEPQVTQAVDDVTAKKALSSDLKTDLLTINTLIKSAIAEGEELSTQLTSIEERKKEDRAQYETYKYELSQTKRTYTEDLKVLKNWLDAYENDRRKFDDIETKRAEYNRLPEYRRELESQENHLRMLKRDVENIASERDAELRRNERELFDRIGRDTRKLDSHREEHRKLGEALNVTIADLNAKKEAALDALESHEFVAKISELQNLASEARSRANRKGLSEEDQERIDSIQDHVSTLQVALDTLTKEFAAKIKAKDAKQDELSKNSSTIEKALAKVGEYKEKLKRLETLANNNSLFNQLKDDPLWDSHISRVINPELLLRQDLSPQSVSGELEQQETLFGWRLDLEGIEQPGKVRELSQIDYHIESTKDRILAAEEELTSLGSDRSAIERGLRGLEAEISVQERHILEKQEAVEQYRQKLLIEKAEAQVRADQVRKFAAAQVSEYENAIASLRNTLSNMKESARQEHKQAVEQSRILCSDQQQGIDEAIAVVESELAKFKISNAERKGEIAKRFTKQCVEKGVDDRAIQKAENDVSAMERHIQKVIGYELIINAYKVFVEEKQARYADKVKQEASLENQIGQLEESAKVEAARFKSKEELHLSNLKLVSQKHKDVTDQKRDLDRLKLHAETLLEESIHGAAAHIADVQYDLFATQFERRIKDLDKVQKSLKKLLPAIKHRMDKLPKQSDWAEKWAEIENRHPSQDGFSVTEEAIQTLKDSVFNYLSISGEGLLNKFNLAFSRLDSLHGKLSNFNEEVRSKGNAIARCVNDNQGIENLSNVQIAITSKAKQSAAWPKLDAAIKLKEAWDLSIESANKALPDMKLVDALITAHNAIENESFYRGGTINIRELINLRLSLTENGQPQVVTSSRDFNNISSNGLSMLALIIVFCGVTRYLSPNRSLRIHWAIDEIGALDLPNIKRMLNTLSDSGICVLSALPTTNKTLLSLMENCYVAKKGVGAAKVDVSKRMVGGV